MCAGLLHRMTFANLLDPSTYDSLSTQRYHTVGQIVVVCVNDEREEEWRGS